MINILFAAHPDRWDEYQAPLTKALNEAGLIFDMRTEIFARTGRLYRLCPQQRIAGFHPLYKLPRGSQSLGRGREYRWKPNTKNATGANDRPRHDPRYG